MGASAEDIIAAKIVCQLGLVAPEVARKALLSLDAQGPGPQPDVTVDLLSRGVIDREGRATVRRFVKIYGNVRRDAAYLACLERSKLCPKEAIDKAVRRAETTRHETRVGEVLVQAGELGAAQDVRILEEVRSVLEREDTRVLESYRQSRYDGCGRAITKDRNARLDDGQLTIKKLFRSKESQRLARMAEAVRKETDRVGPPVAPPPPTARMTPQPIGADGFQRCGSYILLRRLDTSGETELHLARHPTRDRPVALRIFSTTATNGRRHEREALVGRAESEHLPRVLDQGDALGARYLATEHIAGETAQAMIAREAPIDVVRGLRIFRDVARAVAALHAAGVIHAAVTTEAVLLSTREDGTPVAKLVGLRRAGIERGRRKNDPTALVPVLATGHDANAAHDLRGLGGVLVELLAGSPPGQHPRTIAEARAEVALKRGLPAKVDVPSSVEELAARLLSPDPADRPPSAGHVVRALEEIVGPAIASGHEDPARVGAAFVKLFSER